jgi:hypothetical protein
MYAVFLARRRQRRHLDLGKHVLREVRSRHPLKDFLTYETVLPIGAGIGVTLFAALPREFCFSRFDIVYRLATRILKSIWYCMNNFNNSEPTRLSKVSPFSFPHRLLTCTCPGVLHLGYLRL